MEEGSGYILIFFLNKYKFTITKLPQVLSQRGQLLYQSYGWLVFFLFLSKYLSKYLLFLLSALSTPLLAIP